MVFYYIFLSKSNFSALEVGSPTSQPATRPPSPLFPMIRRPSSCQGPCGVWSAAASRSQIVGRRRALPAKWISWILIPGGYMLSRSLCRGSRDRPLAIQLPEVCPVSDHQYQPAVLIKDDNLSIYILISIVDKDFRCFGALRQLDAMHFTPCRLAGAAAACARRSLAPGPILLVPVSSHINYL